jgi:hypothetical protein
VTPEQILEAADTVLLIDWPTPDVPDTLIQAGYEVIVKGGPGPEAYNAWEGRDGGVVVRHAGRPPARAELVYAHRPVDELSGIVGLATSLGALAVWHQSGRGSDGTPEPKGCWLPEDEARRARHEVESAGLAFVCELYIADVVRQRAGE